jgi:UDP-glucose 4-epimerase
MSPYAESKLFIEKTLSWYQRAYGLNWVAMRYFNAAGADADGETGECHDPETHLVPLVIQTALGLRPFVNVFGTDYATPDGTAIRDYVHVWDLAFAHIQALRYLSEGGAPATFNLGAGTGYSVREIIAETERITGYGVKCIDSPRRAGDPARIVADASLARQVLEWHPRYSSLESIIQTALNWSTGVHMSAKTVEASLPSHDLRPVLPEVGRPQN